MKFTNVMVFSVIAIALLNGCSSVFPVKETVLNSNISDAAPELLTPLQTKVKALLAKPNLYKNQASEHTPSTQTRTQFRVALALKQQGDFSQARAAFISLSEQHPDFSGIWLQLAWLAKEQEKRWNRTKSVKI